jgi:hypothetical protein
LFLVDKLEHAVAIGQIVDDDGLGKHIISYTSHLDCVGREEFSSVDKAATGERDWIVSLVHDEHPDKTLVSVNNEISAELMHVFLSQRKLFF